jgi:KDO2-lipid IV(A) lauroyltransferase
MTEFAVLSRLWKEGRIEVQGREHIDTMLAAGRPIVLAALHLGNWEVLGAAAHALGYTASDLYLPPSNRFEHWVVRDARSRFGVELVLQPVPRACARPCGH